MSRFFSYCLAVVFGLSLFAGCTTRHYHVNGPDKVMIKTNPAGTFIKVKDKDRSHPGNSHVKIHVKDKG